MKAFHRMTAAELVGRKVKLLHQITTKGGRIFGAGTVFIVRGKFGGLDLEMVEICDKCGCGNRWSISRVPFTDVELLP